MLLRPRVVELGFICLIKFELTRMKIAQVAKELLDDLADTLRALGFRVDKSKRRCTKLVGNTTQEIQFLFDNSTQGVLLTVMLYVVNESIETIYGQATGTSTNWHIGIDLLDAKDYLEEGLEASRSDKIRFVMPDLDKVALAGQLLKEYIEEYAVRYFAKCDSVQKIDKLLNKHPTEIIVHHYLYPSRAAVGLIAAYLSGNPRYIELSSIYERETRDADPDFRERFEKVATFLNREQ